MPPKPIRLRIFWELLLLSLDGWTIWSWVSGRELAVGSFQVGAPEYFALCLFFTSGMVVIGWVWLRRLSPKVRFQELSPDIKTLVRMMEDDNRGRGEDASIVMSYKTYLEVSALIGKLESLNIPYPNPARENTRIWWEWLPRLYRFSSVGNLKKIRRDQLVVSETGKPIAFGRRDYRLVPIDDTKRTSGLIIPNQKTSIDPEAENPP